MSAARKGEPLASRSLTAPSLTFSARYRRFMRESTVSEPDWTGKWKWGQIRGCARAATSSGESASGSREERRSRGCRVSARRARSRSTRPLPSERQAEMFTPVSTISRQPRCSSSRALRMTSPSSRLTEEPRARGTLQYAHQESQPSWILRNARVWKLGAPAWRANGSVAAPDGRPRAPCAPRTPSRNRGRSSKTAFSDWPTTTTLPGK